MTGNRFNMMKRSQILCLIFISGFSFFTVGTSDFHLIELSKTYGEAKSYCRDMYTDLATVHNFADMNNLVTLVSNAVARAWIGLENGNVWMWHWSLPDYELDFLNWKAGEPQNNFQNQCAAMDQHGKWFESDCRITRSFVCHGVGESKGLVFVANTQSWRDAQNHCRSLSSDLVGIHSAKENEAVLNVSVSQNVWIGLFKDPWKWSDGSNSSFRNWKPIQPDYNVDRDCVAAIFKDAGQWNDLKCSTRRNFVCHGASKLIPTTTKPASTKETLTTNQLPTNMTAPPNTSSQGVTATFTFTTSTKQPNTTNVTTEGETTATGLTTPNTTDVVYSTLSTEVNSTTGVQVTTYDVSASTAQNTTQLSTITSTENSQFLPPGNLILIQQNRTWIEAMSYCREHHHDLVHITTNNIQEQVAERAKNATSAHVWLGLRYTCKFNFWFWTKSNSGCYQNWAPGQGSERTYDCGVTGAIEATGRQQWVGMPNTEKLNFICTACVG
uniref:C-type lectin domain-containing protein n=1 Tax=Scophthalmus maximus TaxID=52904 RepID=A0A8D2ZDF9_SCOMX